MIEYPLSEAQERKLLQLRADEITRDARLTERESAELRFLVELSGGLSKDEWEMERSSVEDIRRELSDLAGYGKLANVTGFALPVVPVKLVEMTVGRS